ncbi:MAG: hypothetical protein AAFQ22_08200 [Pseudomonadota bacterium]
MTFAKYTVFELIRALRRLGTVGLFIMGLLVGSTLIAVLTDHSEQSGQGRFSADASERSPLSPLALPSQPWSRVMGDGGFEKITDVAVTQRNELVFAGLTLGVEQDEASRAVIVRTGPHGFVHSQFTVEHPDIGSVSRAVLDDDGAARLVHWVGMRPAFARTDALGNVVWSRAFDVQSDQVWADIQDAQYGHSLIALAGSDRFEGSLRIVRLDDAGKQLWRGDLAQDGEVETIHLFDSGDGGALIALQARTDDDVRAISLARLDRRGRLAWQRELLSSRDARLADAALDSDGSIVLLAGAPSALIRFDGLGQLSWMRDVPALSMSGRHVIASMEDGGVQVMAEPVTSSLGRRHWVARFNPDGRELWSRTRANRSNATLEAAKIAPNGVIVAGGSMVGSADGDTDMLMMAVADDGVFPQGFGSVPTFDTPQAAIMVDVDASEPTVLAASMVVDGSLALEAAYAADTAALQATVRPAPIRLPPSNGGLIPEPDRSAVAALEAEVRADETLRPEMRQISAPLDVAALAAADPDLADIRQSEPEVAEIEPVGSEATVETIVRAALAEADQVRASTESARTEAAAWSPRDERPAYAYQCTFTCLADSEDVVKYPVTRMIANVAEENSNLVSLDVMAMDNGICLATGGRVFDTPRLPPVCDRVN